MKKDPSKLLFYGVYGDESWHTCFWCSKPVFMSFKLSPEESRKRDAGCVHHLDHVHENNVIENLAGMHYGCHIAYHRSVRPLVAKGSKLPKEWAAKIAAATSARMAVAENRQQISESTKRAIRERPGYNAPLWCIRCRRGPFDGIHGMNSHLSRGICEPDTTEYKYFCRCGHKSTMHRALVKHINHWNSEEHYEVTEEWSDARIC